MASGEDESETRAPASAAVKPAGEKSVVIENRSFDGNFVKPSTGTDIGRNEFGVPSTQGGTKANDPWFGTGADNDGSLWDGEGQQNFYFSVNTNYKIGDVIMVKVDSDVNDALNSRIAALLGPRGKSVRNVVAEEAGRSVASKVGDQVTKATGNDKIGAAVGESAGDKVQSSLDLAESYVNVDEIPVRITQRLDGRRFNVEGSRKVFIKNAPYQVVMKGVLRHEDIARDGSIPSSKVLESKLELTK
jgi:flagellar basal body L-ring protein FlgH